MDGSSDLALASNWEVLRRKFPLDEIEPVGKGQSGADLVHRVFNDARQRCGSML
jgi:hypothetical protein